MFNIALLHVNLISFILLVIRGITLHSCKIICTNFPGCHPPFSTPGHSFRLWMIYVKFVGFKTYILIQRSTSLEINIRKYSHLSKCIGSASQHSNGLGLTLYYNVTHTHHMDL